MTSTEVIKLVGAPGSGKTTKLLEFAEEEADENDVGPGEVMFCTFSRSAQQEVTGRFLDVYPSADEDDLQKRVKTVHGTALSACIGDGDLTLRTHEEPDQPGQLLIRRNNDRDTPYFKWFFGQRLPSVEYDPAADDPIKQLEGGESVSVPAGNHLMAMYDYLQSKDWDLEDYYRVPFYDDVDLAPAVIREGLAEWEAFKEKHDLIQDADYLQMALENGYQPLADVLFIDEFQDLSPLQCRLYEQWRDDGDLDRIYIAGDIHQTIYGFRGANPQYFQQTPADRVVHHEESKRCPEAVIDAARPVVSPPEEHDVSRVSAWKTGGEVAHVAAPSPADLGELVTAALDEHDELYLLARTNHQAGKLAYGLREAGVPYLDLKPDGHLRRWQQPMPVLLAALRGFERGKSMPPTVASTLLVNASQTAARAEAKEKAADGHLRPEEALRRAFPPKTYREWFPEAERARDIVPHLDLAEWRRELLLGALRSGADNDPEQVRIGTVHAAKGLEAPCVLVFPAYSQAQLSRFRNGAEAEERRLFYVAMTRASRAVKVVHDYFGGPEFPPLEAA